MTQADWARVEELFHAALGREPAERVAFLREACGGNGDLRREVESLLAEEREAERLMEESAAGAVTQRLAVVRGTRLGPYEVMDLLGAGGMGEVYRARDTRLGRDVAIKVLPEHVAHDREALARFGREARAVAALSHPHIASLFDIGETDGTHYLVLELLEGETLAARLRRGAPPEAEALEIGAQIAEALSAAHGHGVVHRDVKPANVMLTRSGVKLLDFGLARLQHRPGPSGETAPVTTGLGAGTVAGTLPYMAPEQLEGRQVDARTDIWALGCLLFEMVAGRRAFEANSQAGLIAAIERDDAPQLTRQRPAASAALDRLVRRCLQKDPADRWQSAADVALRLREIAEEEPDAGGRPGRRQGHWSLLAIAGGAVLFALLAGLAASRLWPRPSAAAPVVRSQIELPPEAALVHFMGPVAGPSASRTELALSPDGRLLVWSGSTDGHSQTAALYARALDTGETRRLPGTDGAHTPSFSPDGRWIAFYSAVKGGLRKVPLDGGLAVDLADWDSAVKVGNPDLKVGPMGVSWAEDGRIYLGSGAVGLRSVPLDGGRPTEITHVDRARESGHRLPCALPGGRALLFTAMPHAFGVRARIEAVRLESGERKQIVDDAADARYLPTGHLVFVRQGTVMAAPFDPERLELRAPPVPVIAGVRQALNMGGDHLNTGAAQLVVSASGLLVYAPGSLYEDPPGELVLVGDRGWVEPLPGFDRPLCTAQYRFSPDGRQLAFVERARSGLLWLFDLERRTERQLTREGIAGFPVWSPDGSRVVVGWSREGPANLWSIPVEAESPWERLTEGEGADWPSSWSPDGRWLAFCRGGAKGGVLLLRLEDRQVVPFLVQDVTKARAQYPEFSPDGRWLAYVSLESGQPEVYVTSVPDRRATRVVSRGGGWAPAWSRDGRRLYYRSMDDAAILSVSFGAGPTPSLGQPAILLPTPTDTIDLLPVGRLEMHPDGRRFLFALSKAMPAPPPVTRLSLVHNWFTELERLSPTHR